MKNTCPIVTKYNMNEITRNKKKAVLRWLFYLKENNYFQWPTHAMYVKDWFDFFQVHHPDEKIFTELRYFTLQMNSICRNNLFPDLRRFETRNSNDGLMFEIVDNDIPYMVDTTPYKNSETEHQDKQTQTDCKYDIPICHMNEIYFIHYSKTFFSCSINS